MNLIDLRNYSDDSTKIVKCRDSYVLFLKNDEIDNGFTRNLYLFNNKEKKISKINKEDIPSCEGSNYSYIYKDNMLITNAFEEKSKYDILSVYKINTDTGDTQKICAIKLKKNEDFGLKFLNERYFIGFRSEYGIDDNHLDVDKDIAGEYEHAYLYDMEEKKTYEIMDKRLVLSRYDDIFLFKSRSKEFLFFGEHYMEDYEQEEMFKDKRKKSAYTRNSYRESVNVIEMQDFLSAVTNSSQSIPFNQIYKTELNGITRFFGEDAENIYFRVKDFNIEIETICVLNKNTLVYTEDKKIKEMGLGYGKDSTMWHDEKNMRIYCLNIKDKRVNVKDILNNSIDIEYDIKKGDFNGVIEKRYLITTYFVDNVDNTSFFTEIIDLKSDTSEKYESSCEIYKDNLILIYSTFPPA